MTTCTTCEYWKEGLYGFGVCSEINSKVEAMVTYGWDGGVVDCYETENDFGCNLHKVKE